MRMTREHFEQGGRQRPCHARNERAVPPRVSGLGRRRHKTTAGATGPAGCSPQTSSVPGNTEAHRTPAPSGFTAAGGQRLLTAPSPGRPTATSKRPIPKQTSSSWARTLSASARLARNRGKRREDIVVVEKATTLAVPRSRTGGLHRRQKSRRGCGATHITLKEHPQSARSSKGAATAQPAHPGPVVMAPGEAFGGSWPPAKGQYVFRRNPYLRRHVRERS